MHDFSRFSCLWSGAKALLFTEAGVKVTDVILLLPAGINVTFIIFTFTRANIIDGEQKFAHKFAFA